MASNSAIHEDFWEVIEGIGSDRISRQLGLLYFEWETPMNKGKHAE